MKQLKFMLAAATAIGIAVAAQAADYPSSTDFEDEDVGPFPASGSGWSVPSDGSNESEIIEDASMVGLETAKYTKKYGSGSDAHTKALQVSTAVEPILRYIETNQEGGASSIQLSDTQKVYIDTMVQFTPTPVGEEPKPGADDKLMLYAQEVTKTVDDAEVTTTNLFVIASEFIKGNSAMFKPDTYSTNHIDTGKVIETNTWYRLTVTAYAGDLGDKRKINLFTIKLDGEDLTAGRNLFGGTTDNKLFPSIQGAVSGDATISSVGFAGEGKVDDLVMTTDDPTATAVDFTFALTWSDDKISSVAYTTGGDIITKDANITGYEANGEVVLTITPASWYKLATEGTVTLTLPSATPEEAISLDGYVTKAADVTTVDGKVTVAVTENTKPSDVGVKVGSFSAADTAPAELNKALTWALNKGGATTAAGAGNVVGALNFAEGEEETDAEKAYLLDCTEAELSGEIAKFKFAGFDLTDGFTVGTEKQVGDKAAYGNGYVEVRGDTAVNGAYTEAADTAKHNFFKAFLVPFQPTAAEVE